MKKIAVLIIVLMMTLTMVLTGCGGQSEFGEFQWSENPLTDLLPIPESNIGNITRDDPDIFMIRIGGISKEQYNSYIGECVKNGFTVDVREGDLFYYAYDESGYDLSLSYHNEVMSITIKEPKDEEEISSVENSTASAESSSKTASTVENNTESTYAKLIPDPKSIFVNGVVSIEDPDGGTSYIFNVSNFKNGEFETYISECKKLGFNDVSYNTEKDFGAYSSDGKHWVQVNLDKNKNLIYVVCQVSKKK